MIRRSCSDLKTKLDASGPACYHGLVKCPACQRELTALQLGPVQLDACQNGCGGVWFDAAELNKANAAIPSGQPVLADLTCDPDLKVDAAQERKCGRCANVKLEHKLFSLGTGVIMDCCPNCGGTWLDYGELETIREETHPRPPQPRQVTRSAKPKSIPINFEVVQQVQHLRISQ